MPIPAQLVELRSRLEIAGMIIVEEPDHLNIRLPFFCSVRVYSDGERLRFESFFGVVSRVKSTTLKVLGIGVLAVGSIRFGLAYAGVTALVAILGGLYDSVRWQITEHAITRVSTLAVLIASDPLGPRMTSSGTSQFLQSGASPSAPPSERVLVRERRDD